MSKEVRMRDRSTAWKLVAALLVASPAVCPGEVVDVGQNGFTVRETITLDAPASRAYAVLVDEVGKWWDSEHTFSRSAANLSIETKPQGCFCEKLPGQGGVRHLTVVMVAPGKMIRFEGGLGPLQAMGLAGSMTWSVQPAEKGTAVEARYMVGGYNPAGFKDLSTIVDSVLRAQWDRYKRYVETGKP
jgi:hypothetical protein